MNFAALKNSDGSHWHRHFHEPGKLKEQLSLSFFGQAIVATNIKRHETEKTPCFSLNKKNMPKWKNYCTGTLKGEEKAVPHLQSYGGIFPCKNQKHLCMFLEKINGKLHLPYFRFTN
jgi:hypothetical protein